MNHAEYTENAENIEFKFPANSATRRETDPLL